MQGGHKPGKHGNSGKLREFEKLSGKLREVFNFCRKPGELKENVRYVT